MTHAIRLLAACILLMQKETLLQNSLGDKVPLRLLLLT